MVAWTLITVSSQFSKRLIHPFFMLNLNSNCVYAAVYQEGIARIKALNFPRNYSAVFSPYNIHTCSLTTPL